MTLYTAAVEDYRPGGASVRKVVDGCAGLAGLSPGAKVFVKPNIVFWTRACSFPRWGVITTTRVLEDVLVLLRERGAGEIVIGEGMVGDPRDRKTPAHAFETLGYNELAHRYGAKVVNVMERPFEEVSLGPGVSLRFNRDALESDFFVNLPVLKTHNQTVVSLGIKNLKGLLDLSSRKKCHSPDPDCDLDAHVALLPGPIPPGLTLIDGIYSLERGPAFDGRARRSDLLVASPHLLTADLVGAHLLGHDPAAVPHLARAAAAAGRSTALSHIKIVGEDVQIKAHFHDASFPYESGPQGEMPRALVRQGLRGLFYRKFDGTMCTYCSALNGLALTAIRGAWQGEDFPGVEVLTGKKMEPAPGMAATVLIGKCMTRKNSGHNHISKEYTVPGCPPDPGDLARALQGAGIAVDEGLFAQAQLLPGFFLGRYEGDPLFDESFFSASSYSE